MWILWIIFIVLLIYLYRKGTSKPAKFPPGPPRRLFMGSFQYLKSPGQKFSQFQSSRILLANYGKIVGFYAGLRPAVIISDYDIAKELLKRDDVSSRPKLYPANNLRPGHEFPGVEGRALGLLLSHGQNWRETRRFVTRNLRDFGFGKTGMEEMILTEVQKLTYLFEEKVGKPLDLQGVMNVAIVNALWSIMVGETFELDDPKVNELILMINATVSNSSLRHPLVVATPFPGIIKLPFFRDISGYAQNKEAFAKVTEYLRGYLKNHRQTMEEDFMRDLLDVLLFHSQAMNDVNSAFFGKKGEATILNVLLDLFIAGMETTASSLIWTFLYMLHYPNIQKKVHQEIDKVN